ncbi:hypothetical protein EN784_01510 [bacterium M00.F.Ca.ET.141.01.1.1]|nr:hypothetical protein EN784_01510 [bacterium M00.F.Ca.ET.141.01.1.1]
MINLTRYDDVKFQIKATDIIRVRQTTLNDGPNGNSRISDVVYGNELYNDVATVVAKSVAAEVKTFISLTQPGGDPVWFNGATAKGPVFVSKADQTPDWSGKINSALMIGDKKQFVKNTPQEVYDAIQAQGGVAIPPKKNEFSVDAFKELEGGAATSEVWDAELYLEPGV